MGSNYQRNYDNGQKGGDEGILHDEISSINFRVYSSDELVQLSACHVNSASSFDALHHPTPGKIFKIKNFRVIFAHIFYCSLNFEL